MSVASIGDRRARGGAWGLPAAATEGTQVVQGERRAAEHLVADSPQPRGDDLQVSAGELIVEVWNFVDAVRALDPGVNVVVLGDLNDFEFSPTIARLTAGGLLTDLVTTLPTNERYNYVFQGNSQTLDHILVRGRIKHLDYDIVHINAEFWDQASDHDPQIVRIKPGR